MLDISQYMKCKKIIFVNWFDMMSKVNGSLWNVWAPIYIPGDEGSNSKNLSELGIVGF